MAKRETHTIVIDEDDFKWLAKFVDYGESISDAMKKVRCIVECRVPEPGEHIELVTPPGYPKCDLSEES